MNSQNHFIDYEPIWQQLAIIDKSKSRKLERKVLQSGVDWVDAALARFETAQPPLRARLCRLLGQVTQSNSSKIQEFLIKAINDQDLKTRCNAMDALSKHTFQDLSQIETILLKLWSSSIHVEEQRVLAETFGNLGLLSVLNSLAQTATRDPKFKSILEKATLKIERSQIRTTASSIIKDTPAPFEIHVRWHCRKGLVSFLNDELKPYLPTVIGSTCVEAHTQKSLQELFNARTFLRFGIILDEQQLHTLDSLEEWVTKTIVSSKTQTLLRHWTLGPIRYRIAWSDGHHHRASTWNIAQRVRALAPELINDPTQSTWEVIIGLPSTKSVTTSIELWPKSFDDPRFRYRIKDVPAASHPTIAATLAIASNVTNDDTVWDPFVGSATELIECSRIARFAQYIGSDCSNDALESARANSHDAQINLSLFQADATTFVLPEKPSLILTNPPMGRRVLRAKDLEITLNDFLKNAAAQLKHFGRMVWISPRPEATLQWAKELGLQCTLQQRVDLGGFDGEIQRFEKR